MSGNAVGRHAVDDDDFNCLSPVELIQVVGLGPQCDVFEFVSSGLDVAGWNYDICVVEVNLVSRGGSALKDTGPTADPWTMLAEMFTRVEVEPPNLVQ